MRNVRKYSKILDAESTESFQTRIDTDLHGFDILWPDTFNHPPVVKQLLPFVPSGHSTHVILAQQSVPKGKFGAFLVYEALVFSTYETEPLFGAFSERL